MCVRVNYSKDKYIGILYVYLCIVFDYSGIVNVMIAISSNLSNDKKKVLYTN